MPKNCFSIYNAILPLPTMCSKVQIVLAIVCSMFSCPSSFTTKFPQIFTFATFSHRSFPPFRTSKHRTIRFHTRFPSFAVSNPSHEVVIQILDVDFPVVGIGTKGGHLPRLARCLTRVLWCPKTHHRREEEEEEEGPRVDGGSWDRMLTSTSLVQTAQPLSRATHRATAHVARLNTSRDTDAFHDFWTGRDPFVTGGI